MCYIRPLRRKKILQSDLDPNGPAGCDADLEWWFSAEAEEELAKRRATPARKLTIADLPAACRAVLLAP